jgi:uncharacterized protein (TIGR02679 family)
MKYFYAFLFSLTRTVFFLYILRGEVMENNLQAIVQYFKSDSGFDRIIRMMFDVYLHHGRTFGAVRVTQPSGDEETALSVFFKRDYYNQALIRIGLADFERQMHRNFSDEFSLGVVLAEYLGKSLSVMKTRETIKPSTFSSRVSNEIIPKFENTPAAAWLKEVTVQTRRGYRTWSEKFLFEPDEVVLSITNVANALNNVNKENKLIPIAEFSKKYIGSPDAFDFYGTHGQLFLKALACRFDIPTHVNIEDYIKMHLRAGLLSYGMLSRVTVFGLGAKTYDGDTDTACGYYNDLYQSHILTLENLSRIANVSAHGGKVFIFEDSQIFAAVLSKLNGKKCTLVCSDGKLSAAFMYLLKLLSAANIPMYYAGSMTDKGLELADRLYVEFSKNFVPWRYSDEDFTRILSENAYTISQEKKHLALHNDTFAGLLSHMRKTGKTAPSTPLIPYYADDIKKSVQ